MTKNVLESCRLLTKSIPLFTRKCVQGIEVDVRACRRDAERSLALSSIVAAVHGYDVGARAAGHAAANGATIRDAVVELGIMSEQDADRLLDPQIATDGARSAELAKTIKLDQPPLHLAERRRA
jgi:aspartate ammonia-lyase